MNRRYDLVILDFHGTQTDHALRVIRAYHDAAKEMRDMTFGKEFYQQLLTRPMQVNDGTSHKDYIWELWSGISDDGQERFYRAFRASMDETFIPVPGMRPMCRALADRGVALALLTNGTNKEDIQKTLRRWGMDTLTPFLYCSHEIGAKKPNPAAIEYVLGDMNNRGFGMTAARTLVVGDYRGDIEAAAAAGADSALIVRVHSALSLKIVEPRPTHIICDPRELIAVVDGSRDPETRAEIPLRPLLWQHEGGLRGAERG